MQDVSRRTFFKVGGTGLLIASAVPTTLLLEACSTAWVDTVLNDLPVVVNIVSSIVAVVAQATGNGAISATVGALITQATQALTASLNAFKDAVTAYNSAKTQGNLQAVIAALTAAQANVQKVIAALPAGSVSPTIMTIIVAAMGTAVTVLSAIQSLIPGAAPVAIHANAVGMAAKEKVVLPNSGALKVGYNSVLALHGFGGQQI